MAARKTKFTPPVFAAWNAPASGPADAPFDDPVANIKDVIFHSALNYLSGSLSGSATVTHSALGGVTGSGAVGAPDAGPGSSGRAPPISDGDIRTDEYVLFNHGLGYVPAFQVMLGDQVIGGGFPIQDEAGGGRLVSSHADATYIYLYCVSFSSAQTLPVVSRTYSFLVFRNPAANPALPQGQIKPASVIAAKGKVNSNERMLRVVGAGDSTLYRPVGKSSDVRNGGIRCVAADGTVKDFGPYNGPLLVAPAIKVTVG